MVTIHRAELKDWITFNNVSQIQYTTTPGAIAVNQLIKTKIINLTVDRPKMYELPYKDRLKRFKRQSQAYEELGSTKQPRLHHEYGMLFNHHGYLLSGLQRLYLFLAIDLPTPDDLLHTPPRFPNCTHWAPPDNQSVLSAEFYGHSPSMVYQHNLFKKKFPHLMEPVHHEVCKQFQDIYERLQDKIEEVRNNITYKIEEIIPRLLPNERVFQNTESDDNYNRSKRAIPVGAIISGITGIGGLIMKGINTFANYKKSRAMSKAMNMLHKQNNLLHNRMIRIENTTSYIAKASKTAFLHLDGRLTAINQTLLQVNAKFHNFVDDTNRKFEHTWEVVTSNRLAIKMLGASTTLYKTALQEYLGYYYRYDTTLDHFIDGLDALGTGRLTYQILDPVELQRFLEALNTQLNDERSPFELAFDHTYQYYAQPLVSFSNSRKQLLVQIPILLKLREHARMTLYSIETVPIPFDTKTLDGERSEYTFINNSYPYMATSESNYIPLNEQQLRLCTQIGPTYYCENSYVLRHRSYHTCESAIFYKEDETTITSRCNATFVANKYFPPKVLDAGQQLLLFNLPRPWILMCGATRRPVPIPYATYKIINRTEFCECDLSAGSFHLGRTMVKCPSDPNSFAYDGKFTTYYSINKIIFDHIQASFRMTIPYDTKMKLTQLLEQKPHYDWRDIHWYQDDDMPATVLDHSQSPVITNLMHILQYMIDDLDETMFPDQNAFYQSQNDFNYFMRYASYWRKVEFVSALLGLLALVILLVVCIFRAKIFESIILSSQVLEQYQFHKGHVTTPSAPLPAGMAQNFQYPNLPEFKPFSALPPEPQPDWEDHLTETVDAEKQLNNLVLTITGVLLLIVIIYIGFRKCRYASSIARACFPLYPVSTILRGTARTDIFLEITNISTTESIWAYCATTAVHPSMLTFTGRLKSADLSIVSLCCLRQVRIEWKDCLLLDHKNNIISLPKTAVVSAWTDNNLKSIDRDQPYNIKVFGRVLDLVQEIAVDENIQLTIDL